MSYRARTNSEEARSKTPADSKYWKNGYFMAKKGKDWDRNWYEIFGKNYKPSGKENRNE